MSRLQAAAAVLLAGAAAGSIVGGVRTHDRAVASDHELGRALQMRGEAQREEAAQALIGARIVATRVAAARLEARATAGDRGVVAAIRAARRAHPRIVVGAPRTVYVRLRSSAR